MHCCMTGARYVHWCLPTLGRRDLCMRNITSSWAGALVVLGSLTSNEAHGERSHPEEAAEVSLLGCSDAGEHWRGVTRSASLELTEDVTLDAAGRLAHAETHALDPSTATDVRVFYDRATRSVVVASRGVTRLHVIEGEGAWVYDGVTTRGRTVPTRLAALVAYRASRQGSMVRVVDAAHGTSARVPTDQVLVETERGQVAVLGDTAFELATLAP